MRVHALAYAQTVLGAALALGCNGSPCPTGQALCGQACVDPQVDNANCGGCGLTCDSCTAGRCKVTLATGRPISIAVDHSRVYWTNAVLPPSGIVLSTPVSGGRTSTLVGSPSPSPFGMANIAANLTTIYWMETFGLDNVTFSLGMVPLAGGPSVRIGPVQAAFPVDLAADDANVYWTSLGTDSSPYGTGYLMKATATGTTSGVPTVLYSSTIWGPCGVAVDSENVYWLNTLLPSGDKADLMKMPLRGGAPTSLAHTNYCGNVAVDAKNVYWTSNGAISKISISGGQPTKIIEGPEASATAFAIDGSSVYWVRSGAVPVFGAHASGTVLKVSITGGAAITLSTHEDLPGAIAVDDTSVYWANEREVRKLTPK